MAKIEKARDLGLGFLNLGLFVCCGLLQGLLSLRCGAGLNPLR